MKIGELVLAWLFSVILGSVLCGLVLGDLFIAIIFIIISGLFSLPYLIIMILLSRISLTFMAQQGIHLALAFLTGFVIVLFENNAFKFFYVLILYFILGVIAQAYFFKRKPLLAQSSSEDLLDS
jgi:hypothetical protein